jgi:hypothetical protein
LAASLIFLALSSKRSKNFCSRGINENLTIVVSPLKGKIGHHPVRTMNQQKR